MLFQESSVSTWMSVNILSQVFHGSEHPPGLGVRTVATLAARLPDAPGLELGNWWIPPASQLFPQEQGGHEVERPVDEGPTIASQDLGHHRW